VSRCSPDVQAGTQHAAPEFRGGAGPAPSPLAGGFGVARLRILPTRSGPLSRFIQFQAALPRRGRGRGCRLVVCTEYGPSSARSTRRTSSRTAAAARSLMPPASRNPSRLAPESVAVYLSRCCVFPLMTLGAQRLHHRRQTGPRPRDPARHFITEGTLASRLRPRSKETRPAVGRVARPRPRGQKIFRGRSDVSDPRRCRPFTAAGPAAIKALGGA